MKRLLRLTAACAAMALSARPLAAAVADDYLFHVEVPDRNLLSFVSNDKMPGKGLSSDERSERTGKWKTRIESLQRKRQAGAVFNVETFKFDGQFRMIPVGTDGVSWNSLLPLVDTSEVNVADPRNGQKFKVISKGGADFTMKWICPDDSFVLRNEQCVRDLWVGSWANVSNRWESLRRDGKLKVILDEKASLAASGRYSAPGGATWERRVENYCLAFAVLPDVTLENKSGRKVWVVVENVATNRLAASGSGARFTFKPDSRLVGKDGRIRFRWHAVYDDEGLCEKDYEIMWHEESTDADGGDILKNIPAEFACVRKRRPRCRVLPSVLPQGWRKDDIRIVVESIPAGAKSAVEKEVLVDDLQQNRGGLELEVQPHAMVNLLRISYPGFQEKVVVVGKIMCCGEECEVGRGEARIKRLPWPEVVVVKKKDEPRCFKGKFNVKVEVEGAHEEALGVDMFATRMLDDGFDGKWKTSDRTNLTVTVSAWSDEAKEDTYRKLVTKFEVYRGAGRIEIPVPLHDYEPPEWPEKLSATETYIANTLAQLGASSEKSKQKASIAGLCKCRNIDDLSDGKIIGETHYKNLSEAGKKAIGRHAEVLSQVIKHVSETKENCISECGCKSATQGESYYSVLRDMDPADRRVAAVALAARRGGHNSNTMEALMQYIQNLIK